MPISKNAMRRCMIIDQVISERHYHKPTMQRILELCKSQGIDVSSETIQKDINMMKKARPNGFGAPIKFDFQQQEYIYTDPKFTFNGVKLTPEDASVIEESMILIKCILRTELGDKLRHAMEKVLSTSLEEFDNQDHYPMLKTMDPPRSRGYEFMDIFLECCRYKIPMSFIHYSYKNEVFKPVVLHPYVVREFENRWYVFGFSEKHNDYRSFGLDRIYEPIKLQLNYKNGNIKQIRRFLNDMYGVFPLAIDEPVEVVLKADPLTTKFLSAYPIHESQVVEKTLNGSSSISLTLIPTMELIHLVWSYGPSIRILSPLWLIDKQKSLKYYQ